MSAAAPRVVGIGGSLRAASLSNRALELVLERVRARGGETQLFDMRTAVLPFCNGDKKEPWPAYPDVARLRQMARGADALVLATPEYHGGMSGVLKNAVDLLDFEHLEGKVVGAVSVLGGMSNSSALNDVRRVMRWCHAWVVPEQVAIGRARTTFVDGRLDDPELLERIDGLAASLVRNAVRLGERFAPPEWPAPPPAKVRLPLAVAEERVSIMGGNS